MEIFNLSLEKTCGVYLIQNIVDGKCYVGHSLDIRERLKDHIKVLRRGTHHSTHLQRAWNKYGEDSFILDVLEECPPEDRCKVENYWCILLASHNRESGYNIAPTDDECKRYNSEETRKKLSIALTGKKRPPGRKLSEEHKKSIGNHSRGRVVSEETRRKISEGKKGKKIKEFSPIHKERIGKALKGRVFSKETIKRMSESRKRICKIKRDAKNKP